jgi:hypothetical protein
LTAVGKSIDVEVGPDPTSCSLTAGQLATLAEACEHTQALLGGHARLGEDQFGGLSGIVYRHSSTRLVEAAERIGRRSRRLAAGLTAFAQGMAEVQRLMDDAVAVAVPHLLVGGGRIWSPAQPTGGDETSLGPAWAAWHEAVASWRAARELELRTSQNWIGLLGRAVAIDDSEPPVLVLPLHPCLEGADR